MPRDELRDNVFDAKLPEVGLLEAAPEGEMRSDELCPDASDVGMPRDELEVSKMLEPLVALASKELTNPATSRVDVDDELPRTEERLLLRLSLGEKDILELSGRLIELEEAKNEEAVGVRMGGVLLEENAEIVVLSGVDESSALLINPEETILLSEPTLERIDVRGGVGGVEVTFVVSGT
jgi:hypothetical protein